MDLPDLKEALKRYGFDDSDPLDTWINAAYHEIESAHSWPFLHLELALSLEVGAAEFSLPSDFFRPIKLKNLTSKGELFYLEYRRWTRDIRDATTTGQPEMYTLFGGNTVRVWRVPEKKYDFTMSYERKLSDLSDGSPVPAMPEFMHYTIVRGSAYIALQAENEEERAITAQGQFEEDLIKQIGRYGNAQLGQMDSVDDAVGLTSRYGY